MRLWKMELGKLLGRPVLNLGLFLIMGFLVLVFWRDVTLKRTEVDGVVYQGIQAIEADRRLAREYQGLLTMEIAEQIAERFGFSGYVETDQDFSRIREGNFCSQWITDKMTDFLKDGEKPTAFATGERWEEYGKRYLEIQMQFGYTGGWEYFHQMWSWAVLYINIWLVLIVSPVFSEEYSRKTSGVLLATQHGRQKDIWAKTGAALAVGGMTFLMVSLLLLGLTVCVYGGEGLELSAAMCDYRALYAQGGKMTMEGYLWNTFVSKLVSVCFNSCIVLWLSSRCGNTVSVALLGLALYPFSWLAVEVVYGALFDFMYSLGLNNHFWGWAGIDLLSIICSITPYSLAWSSLIGIPPNWLYPIAFLLLGAMSGCIWRAFVNYRRRG